MRATSDGWVAIGAALFVIAGVAWALYRPRVQQSERYQATVVPLANIMDVGFIVLSPAIVLLAGFAAPLVMLGICLLAIATGFAISYNIRHQEPIEGTKDSVNTIARFSQWALLAASVVNISYYTLLLITLVLWPLDAYSTGALAVWGTVYLVVIGLIGWFGGINWLNRQADKTTAFNLAAVFGVVVAFVFYNIQEWLGGRWALGSTEVSITTDDFRKIIGLFAMVQGFEAARYIGSRFGADRRISSMRLAQYISSVVFVVLVASILVVFLPPVAELDGTAIFVASDLVGPALPWIVLLAAIGSQTSAILGATSSRSDMIVNAGVGRKWSFVIILVPTIALFLLTDVTQAVALASRVFAFYFLLQALIAGILASRKRAWGAVAGFAAIGIAMATISVFGISI